MDDREEKQCTTCEEIVSVDEGRHIEGLAIARDGWHCDRCLERAADCQDYQETLRGLPR